MFSVIYIYSANPLKRERGRNRRKDIAQITLSWCCADWRAGASLLGLHGLDFSLYHGDLPVLFYRQDTQLVQERHARFD